MWSIYTTRSPLSSVAPSFPNSYPQRSIGIIALVIGLVIGLALGIFVGILIVQPTQTGTGPNNRVQVSIVIQATDPNDGYERYWGLTFDRQMPPEVSFQGYVGADVNEPHYSGERMIVLWNLTAGLHYLIFAVTQIGGSSYGTYAGTIEINGQSHNFTGLDVTNSVRVDFSL